MGVPLPRPDLDGVMPPPHPDLDGVPPPRPARWGTPPSRCELTDKLKLLPSLILRMRAVISLYGHPPMNLVTKKDNGLSSSVPYRIVQDYTAWFAFNKTSANFKASVVKR